jgi:hypothetical protein
MKISLYALLLICVLPNAACTTFRPTAASAEQIQRLIQSERLLAPGDRIRLMTNDQLAHDFRITVIDLDEGLVIGDTDVVKIQDIAALETRQVSWIKTGLLIGALTLALIDTDCVDSCGYGPYPYYAAYNCCP